ncbi:MAG: rhomboid family intramembrane serine protease [bacterium]
MIPLKDDVPSTSFPAVTVAVIGLNCLVFISQMLFGAEGGRRIVSTFGIIPYELSHFTDLPPYTPIPLPFTLITSMFLHGGLAHLVGNMLYLWIFGDNVEDSMGHVRFAVFYLLCGLAAAFTQIIVAPSSTIPMIGASGAISGVLGAYLLLYPRAKVLTLIFLGFFIETVRIPASLLLSLWIIIQVLSGASSLVAHSLSGGVAWFAHIGGFLMGILLISSFKKPHKGLRIRKWADKNEIRW